MIRGNRGQVLMLVGVMLLALVGFAVLGIDVAYMYLVRHELQRCADSGALAGATWFIDPAPTDTAEIWARRYAMMDCVANTPLTDSEVQVPPPSPDNTFRVETHRTVNFFFAIIFGQGTKYIDASATAKWGVGHNPDNAVQPMAWLVE